ncbi:hypothetical protein BVI1335_120062 [Burkholderia vietnamiensis]|nr:hypothetical protein BVI1335_120062 [Burkholderia vietnamiensis]
MAAFWTVANETSNLVDHIAAERAALVFGAWIRMGQTG